MRFLMLNWRDPENPMAGGAERVTLGYLAALKLRGHEVDWFSYAFPNCQEQVEIQGVHIHRAGERLSAVRAARHWARRQKPFDLVIDQHHGIPWYAPWWCQTRCVAYIHEVLGPIWDSFYRWPLNRIGRIQERWTHWFYRRIPFWTACPSTKTALQMSGVRDVTLIPYGVHTVALPRLEPKTLSAPLQLTAVSRLAPNKRVDHAIRSLRCLSQSGIDARLTVVGTGLVETELRRLVDDLELHSQVQFTGALSEADKDTVLRESHLLLHTSLREGWGLNVIEANAMGTPTVVYPVPGLIESTLHNQTGLVSKAETPESLAESIRWLLQHPDAYARFRTQAWERAKTFHWSKVLPQACDWLERQAMGTASTSPSMLREVTTP